MIVDVTSINCDICIHSAVCKYRITSASVFKNKMVASLQDCTPFEFKVTCAGYLVNPEGLKYDE